VTYLANDPVNLSMDNFHWSRLRPDAEGFVSGSWLYLR